MEQVEVSDDAAVVTVHVPLTFRSRGGRKVVVSPAGEEQWSPRQPRLDNTLLRALVHAFRWKQRLESGESATVSELAQAEKLNTSYVSHVLRLTLLAPDLVESILDGRQPATMQLQPLVRGFRLNGISSAWHSRDRMACRPVRWG